MVVEGGDPERGEVAIRAFGCGSCHRIPGVPGANGNVGPPLAGLARQGYIAGVRRPQEADPLTAMPDMGVSEAHARDIAAYLYSLDSE